MGDTQWVLISFLIDISSAALPPCIFAALQALSLKLVLQSQSPRQTNILARICF